MDWTKPVRPRRRHPGRPWLGGPWRLSRIPPSPEARELAADPQRGALPVDFRVSAISTSASSATSQTAAGLDAAGMT